MDITRDIPKRLLVLKRTSYMEKLSKFAMHESKSINLLFSSHFKLSKEQCS